MKQKYTAEKIESDFSANALLSFIYNAHSHTYAAPEEIRKKFTISSFPILDHKAYSFTEGDWKYQDFYAGFKYPPGKEIIYFKDKPVWTMAYQGKIESNFSNDFIEEIYRFLKLALRESKTDMPFRGPAYFKQGDFEYSFSINGDYTYFVGKEIIRKNGDIVFFQDIMGSMIK